MAAPIRVPTANMALLSDDKSQPTSIESVAAILTRCKAALIEDWLVRTKKTPELNLLHLSVGERTRHLPKLVDDLVVRLARPKLPDKDSDAIASPVFGFVIVYAVVALSGLLGCCIGFFVTLPIGIAALVCAYETIF